MPESVLLDLLHQTDYVDELELFATISVDDLANYELEKLASALDDAIAELTDAIHIDAATGIEFDDAFLQNITTMVGKLACQMGRTVHKLVITNNNKEEENNGR